MVFTIDLTLSPLPSSARYQQVFDETLDTYGINVNEVQIFKLWQDEFQAAALL